MKTTELLGLTFGRLTVVGPIVPIENSYKKRIGCICSCGKSLLVRSDQLQSGNSTSCGCGQREAITKHGMEGTKTYNAWKSAIKRGTGKTHKTSYFDRGIRICERWRTSFIHFLEDMGEAPEGASLDRIDNDGNYEPSNCRWATRTTQTRNRRNTLRVIYKGKSEVVAELVTRHNITYNTVCARLKRGWSIEKALHTPADTRFRAK